MPHINYAYDFTVTAFIVDGSNRVLLVNHPHYNKWMPIGGHIEMHEDPEEALYREIKEETGLAVQFLSQRPDVVSEGTKFLPTPNYVDVHEANPPHKHISFTYFVTTKDVNFVLSDEHYDMRWFEEKDLSDSSYNLSRAILFYAHEAIALAKLHR